MAFVPRNVVIGLTNPLTSDLDAASFDVNSATYVRSDVVECLTLEPQAPQTYIEVNGDLQLGAGVELRVEDLAVLDINARTGNDITVDLTTGGANSSLIVKQDASTTTVPAVPTMELKNSYTTAPNSDGRVKLQTVRDGVNAAASDIIFDMVNVAQTAIGTTKEYAGIQSVVRGNAANNFDGSIKLRAGVDNAGLVDFIDCNGGSTYSPAIPNFTNGSVNVFKPIKATNTSTGSSANNTLVLDANGGSLRIQSPGVSTTAGVNNIVFRHQTNGTTVSTYLKINVAGTDYWVPLVATQP